MNKEKKIIQKPWLIIAFLQMLSIGMYAQSPFDYTYRDKNEILKHEGGRDSLSLNIDNRSFFIVIRDFFSGIERKTIYVYINNNESQEEWRLFCLRDTNTSKVKIEVDHTHKEVVFKSASNKKLMVIPFETLNLDRDWEP